MLKPEIWLLIFLYFSRFITFQDLVSVTLTYPLNRSPPPQNTAPPPHTPSLPSLGHGQPSSPPSPAFLLLLNTALSTLMLNDPSSTQTGSCRLSLPSPWLTTPHLSMPSPLWKPSWLSYYVSALSLLERCMADPLTALLNCTCCSPVILLPVCCSHEMVNYFLNHTLGMPWWLNGKESTCQCWSLGFKPWSGKIPHATEPVHHNH